ncbi:MAG TPA: nicotinamide riboside transporter PnuC, partial [Patescibacteria group bacterium]|nr:nicotinamide riboside transporter PnuC [Patescibacteria group bacterium]
AAWRHWIGLDLTETLGFVTGGWCVWLTVKENVWNWPIGIANSVFFAVLFWNSRLFADMGLQVVYVILGFLGWYWWLRGGEHKTELKVSLTPVREWAAILPLAALATWGMTAYLVRIHDAAPFLDALTTVMSLVAQYLLTKKYLENWFVWIAADVIYIGLYAFKDLYLTSVLYLVFLCMCVAGLKEWQRSKKAASAPAVTAPAYAEAL